MSLILLIVDDEEMIRDMLSRHFSLLDYDVMTAANGREAVRILETKRIDVVITDVMMPDMNGIELLRYIKEHNPTLRPIVITGYVTLDNALSCLRLGAETFIFKPLQDLAELEDAVKRIEERLKNWQRKLRELRGMKP